MNKLSSALSCAALLAAIVIGGCTVPVSRSDPAYNRQPNSETSTQARARIRTELSGGYYARGQYDVALEELNAALRDDPNYAPAYGMLGLVYSELRDDAQAERYFLRSVEMNPQDPEVRNNYGWFLCQRGREVQSLAQFELAVNNPFYRTPDLAMLNAGRCAAKVGDRTNAEAYLQRALNVSPSNPAAHFLLTDIAYRAGDLQLARTRMRTLLAATQSGPEALLMAVCIERKLGNQPDESSYAFQLRQRFPASKEVRLVDSGGCQ